MSTSLITLSQRSFNAALQANDATAAMQMAQAYAQAYQVVKAQSDALLAKISAAETAGEDVNLAWLYQEQRLSVLQASIQDQMDAFAQKAEGITTEAQSNAVDIARTSAKQLVTAAADAAGIDPDRRQSLVDSLDFVSTNPKANANLAGVLQDGSPVRAIFDQLGEEASKSARDILTAGVAVGTNPTIIGAQMRDAFGGNLVRALTVARTESHRAARSAALDTYQQAGTDVIDGWIWIADLSTNTCASCLAMHGTIHPLDEEFGSHPNCRCSPSPHAANSEEETQSGEDWFREQSEAAQREILGNKGYDLYQQGARLADFVNTSVSAEWGVTRTVKAARDVTFEPPKPVRTRKPKSTFKFPPPNELRKEIIDAELQKAGKEWAKSLDRVERKTVKDWSGLDYTKMRANFEAGTLGAPEQSLLSALEDAPQYDGLVWRGINPQLPGTTEIKTSLASKLDTYESFYQRQVGTEITWNAPSSTSLDPQIAYRFGRVVFEIKSETGRYIEQVSNLKQEREVLAMPGSSYRVVSCTRVTVPVDSGGTKEIIRVQLEEIK